MTRRVMLVLVLVLGLLVPAAPASAAEGDGYCGHGTHGWLRIHKFVQHQFWQPTFDQHLDVSGLTGVSWTTYANCGH